MLLFAHLHEMAGRATPNQMINYKLALQLYKFFKYRCPTMDWVSLNFNQIMGTRQKKFSINMTNSKRVGMNALSSRLWYLNWKIDTDWLNFSFNTYKVNCKKTVITVIIVKNTWSKCDNASTVHNIHNYMPNSVPAIKSTLSSYCLSHRLEAEQSKDPHHYLPSTFAGQPSHYSFIV